MCYAIYKLNACYAIELVISQSYVAGLTETDGRGRRSNNEKANQQGDEINTAF